METNKRKKLFEPHPLLILQGVVQIFWFFWPSLIICSHIIKSEMDSNESNSESLYIDEPEDQIMINSSNEDRMDSFDQELDYSKDEESLSFQIEPF